MTIKIQQICDRKGEFRELNYSDLVINPKGAALKGGWREIDGKHICPDCLREIFK